MKIVKKRYKVLLILVLIFILLAVVLALLAYKPKPAKITYGMSFNTLYARELGLDWKDTYDAILDELGVRKLRLAAHWPMMEPQEGVYNYSEIDYQLEKAESVGAEVILAVGHRLPRWPECHTPVWAANLSKEEEQQAILDYLTHVVTRYKDKDVIKIWQVENEPFLALFAQDHCDPVDEDFLRQEIALVKELDDKDRPILVTDSGNLGTWVGAYRNGDMFGTSVYVHFWNPELGQFRTLLPPAAYHIKENLVRLRYGKKPTMLIELSAEPWLLAPVTEVDIDTQLTRMDLNKFEDILAYAEKTNFAVQYLWGAEWWYWMRDHNHPEMWNKGMTLFNN